MPTIKMEVSSLGNGTLGLYDAEKKVGEMLVSISQDKKQLMVFHTEVEPESTGKGYAGLLLENLVQYAREHGLKIVPLCPYVHAQFKKHPELYEDVWQH